MAMRGSGQASRYSSGSIDDVDIAIWNLFHDGTITAIRGHVPGDLELLVQIAYLRNMVQPPGDAFRIKLTRCDLIELQSWADDSVVCDLRTIAEVEPQILSGSEQGDRIVVVCNGYELRLRYQDVEVELDNGLPVTIEAIDALAERYWDEWERKRRDKQT